MTTNPFTFRNISQALPVLCRHVLDGDEIGSRNGRVKELSPVQITLTHPWEREVLTPHRHASLAAQIAETMWVLAGRNDVEWLSAYLPRAKDFSDDGKTWRGAYGPRIRKWVPQRGAQVSAGTTIDQLAEVIEILREDRSSRRAVINLFDPAEDFVDSKDIPCNNWLHFLSRGGKLNLHVAIRSNDLMWGWSGINAFEWSVLQELIANCLGINIGTLTFSISSLHLYDQHWAKAEKIANASDNLTRFGNAPRPRFTPTNLTNWDDLIRSFFSVETLLREGLQQDAENAINAMDDPAMRVYLRVIQHYWTGEGTATLEHGMGISAGAAVLQSPNQGQVTGQVMHPQSDFADYVINLHNEKHEAYGDSWKRRGERVAIQANIARKVDRLGGGETRDETSADTALDLLVYLAKYQTWLIDRSTGTSDRQSDEPKYANHIIAEIDDRTRWPLFFQTRPAIQQIKADFEKLLAMKDDYHAEKWNLLRDMTYSTYCLARALWESEQDDYRGADFD